MVKFFLKIGETIYEKIQKGKRTKDKDEMMSVEEKDIKKHIEYIRLIK